MAHGDRQGCERIVRDLRMGRREAGHERGLSDVGETGDDEGRGGGVEVGPILEKPSDLSETVDITIDLPDEARKPTVEGPYLVAELFGTRRGLGGPFGCLSEAPNPFFRASDSGEGSLEGARPERLGHQGGLEGRGRTLHETPGLEPEVSDHGRGTSDNLELGSESVASGFGIPARCGEGRPMEGDVQNGHRGRGSSRRPPVFPCPSVDLRHVSVAARRPPRIPLPFSGPVELGPAHRLCARGDAKRYMATTALTRPVSLRGTLDSGRIG